MQRTSIGKCAGVFAMMTAIAGCGGVSQTTPLGSLSNPGVGATMSSPYVGTFPLKYQIVNSGGCNNSSMLPTALQVTSVTAGQDTNGDNIVYLNGFIVGGLFNGVQLQNAGIPTTYANLNSPTQPPVAIVEINGPYPNTLYVNMLLGAAAFQDNAASGLSLLGTWTPPAVGTGYDTVTTLLCTEGASLLSIGAPKTP
jgi:hypothetical protein